MAQIRSRRRWSRLETMGGCRFRSEPDNGLWITISNGPVMQGARQRVYFIYGTNPQPEEMVEIGDDGRVPFQIGAGQRVVDHDQQRAGNAGREAAGVFHLWHKSAAGGDGRDWRRWAGAVSDRSRTTGCGSRSATGR